MTHAPLVSYDDRQALHDLRRHLETLTRLGTERLAAGEAFAAFMFADRRCRLGKAAAFDLLLRSEALRRMGFPASGTIDLARAVEFDPTDPFVNRRLIERGEVGAEEAARWVVSDPRSSRPLIEAAVHLMFDLGYPVVGSVTVEGDHLTGWVTSREPRPLTLRVSMQDQHGEVAVQARARIADGGRATRVPLDVRLTGPFSHVSALLDGRPCIEGFVNVRVNPVGHRSAPRAPEADGTSFPSRSALRSVTVIVPVYDDVAVTRRCLAALAAQEGDGITMHVLLVDDAAPGNEMKVLLAQTCERHGFEVIRNERNLGFIGAVNRALARIATGDVLLLNSDVVMPPETVGKLAAAAYAEPGIGVVNPLTNNGQFNSFPSVATDNPFEDEQRIASVDHAAAAAAPDARIATPGGIGYCMYVTRNCLDAVGPVPEVYLRGYYEDFEFSLRARERGFATVCAANCYVGHKGTASFKGEKARLVMRNQRVIEARFPTYKDELAAFRRADPLRVFRAAIEAGAHPIGTAEVVVAGSATYRAVLDARSEALKASGRSAIVLTWSAVNGELGARLQRQGEAEPRQRIYRFDGAGDEQHLVETLLALRPRRIELAGPAGVFRPSLDALLASGLDLGVLLCESLGRAATLERGCMGFNELEPCSTCIENFNTNWRPHGAGNDLHQALTRQTGAPAVVVAMDEMAQEVATDLAGDAFSTSRFEQCPLPARVVHGERITDKPLLALPYPEADRWTERLLALVASTLLRHRGGWNLILLGAGLDDRKLMSAGNLFVTGPVGDDEFVDALVHYGARCLFAPQRWSGYGLVAQLADSLRLPKAYFDWSIGALPARDPDLSIDPRVCDAKAANALAVWLDGLTTGSAS